MRKSLILVFGALTVLGMSTLHAQKNVENHHFKATFLFPGAIYELGLTNNSTLRLDVSTDFSFMASTIGGIRISNQFGFFLGGGPQYRYYLNYERRNRKGKNTRNNSANFIALNARYLFGNALLGDLDFISDVITVGPVYGFQRTYASGFNLELWFGLGYENQVDIDFESVQPQLSFNLGWVIDNKKR